MGRKTVFIGLLCCVSACSAIAAGARVADPDGTTALHWAVRHDDLAAAEALIKAGADVKAANRYGVTPIALAAMNGSAAMIRKLLDAGVDPNSANPGGETALMTAARTGKVDAVTLLLDRGANVNAKDTVHGADRADVGRARKSRRRSGTASRARRRHQCSYQRHDHARASTCRLAPAAASGNGIIRQRALPTPNGGMTPLLFAIRDGNAPMMRLLLDRGARYRPVIRQPHHAAADRSAERAGRDRDGTGRQRRGCECGRRLPSRGPLRGHRSAQLQSRKIWRSSHRRARSVGSDQGSAARRAPIPTSEPTRFRSTG